MESWGHPTMFHISNSQIIVSVFSAVKVMKRIGLVIKMSQEMEERLSEERVKWWERVDLKEKSNWNWFHPCFNMENGDCY